MVARENAQMLSRNYDVTIFSPRYPRLSEWRIQDENVSVHFLTPVLSYGNAAWLPQLIWRLRTYDAIHLHYPFLGAGIAVVCAALLFRKKLIITYHMDLIGSSLLFRFFFSLANWCAPVLLRCADQIFVTSYDYAQHSAIASLLRHVPDRIRELPNSVDESLFHPGERPKDLRIRYGVEEGIPIILFVGGLDSAHYFKGVSVLLHACSLLAKKRIPFHFVLVGDGDLRGRYERMASEMQVSAYVTFAGSLASRLELVRHYALCDVFVLPSLDRSEAFGVVLIEAAACGKPSIASDLPGVRSVIEEGVTGLLIRVGDAKDCAEKIDILLSDPARAKTMGENARMRVLERYSNTAVQKVLLASL